MKGLAVLVLVAGCGRVDFDPLTTDGALGPSDAPRDGTSAAITFVQAKGNSFNGAMMGTLAWPDPVAKGDLLVVGIDYDNTTAVATMSDTLGAAWHATAPSDGFDREIIAYAIAPASGDDAMTVTLSAQPTSFFELRVHAYRGVSPTAPFDSEAENASDTMPATVPITTHLPGQMVFAMTILSSATTASVGPGFTLRLNYVNDVTEDRIVDVPQTLNAETPYAAFASWTTTAVVFTPE